MNKAEKYLFQENVAGANLVMLFVILNMIFTILNLRVMPVMYHIGISVMYNILVSLVGVLASTQVRAYSKAWAYIGFVIAVVQLLRIPTIPEVYEKGFTMALTVIIILSAVSIIAGSLITIRRATLKNNYESGLKAR